MRERKDDIAPLALHFIQEKSLRLNINPPALSRRHVAELMSYPWPGNVSELENVIERALILSRVTGQLRFDLHTPAARPTVGPAQQLEEPDVILNSADMRQHETGNILAALRRTNGKVFGPKGAAQLLCMKPTTLASKIKALCLQKQFVPAK